MASNAKPRQLGGAAGAKVGIGADTGLTPTSWRAQLIAARFELTLESASIVAALALGGAS